MESEINVWCDVISICAASICWSWCQTLSNNTRIINTMSQDSSITDGTNTIESVAHKKEKQHHAVPCIVLVDAIVKQLFSVMRGLSPIFTVDCSTSKLFLCIQRRKRHQELPRIFQRKLVDINRQDNSCLFTYGANKKWHYMASRIVSSGSCGLSLSLST